MLRICAHVDCSTLTLGTFCVDHEPPVEAERFPRGRPYSRRLRRLPAGAAEAATPEDGPTPAGVVVSFGGDAAA
jgi:hypothetical protein